MCNNKFLVFPHMEKSEYSVLFHEAAINQGENMLNHTIFLHINYN